jgi:hypothetical protein
MQRRKGLLTIVIIIILTAHRHMKDPGYLSFIPYPLSFIFSVARTLRGKGATENLVRRL